MGLLPKNIMTDYKFETTTIVDEEKAHQLYSSAGQKKSSRMVSVELIFEQTMSA